MPIQPVVEFDLEEAMAILTRTPATLHALLDGLPERWLRATEGEGTWSPYDVVVHLVTGERTNWLPRVQHILAGHDRAFEPFDRMPEAARHGRVSITEQLSTFTELRRHSVATLRELKLTGADLRRSGLHPAFGEVSLRQLLATWVVHDLDHVAQVVRTMAKSYASEVGPWTAYLSILSDRE